MVPVPRNDMSNKLQVGGAYLHDLGRQFSMHEQAHGLA
jgi:hypothetical protein